MDTDQIVAIKEYLIKKLFVGHSIQSFNSAIK